MINVKLEATYDAVTNDGDVSLEVLLLPKVFNRGMAMKMRSSMDFVTIVRRVALPDDW
ncbi:unnamed protein product, partial [Laminaria digitata]